MPLKKAKRWLNSLEEKEIRFFLIRIYSVGLLGFIIPYTRDIFIAITPLTIILSIFLLLWYHGSRYNSKTIIVFSLVFLLGYFIEAIGVETGLIFGDYWYGSALGPKILGTPPMIGINWLMLAYAFAAIVEPYKISRYFKIIIASLGMLVYDIIIEISAPHMDMWYWKGVSVPIDNYIAWFVIALAFQSMLFFANIKFNNPVAKTLVICQLFFFLLLAGFFTIF